VALVNPPLPETPGDEETVAFVPMLAVDGGTGQVTTPEERRYIDVKKGYTPFLNGDVIVAKITPCFENGKIAHAKIPHPIGVGSTEFHVIRPHKMKADVRYIFHFLRQVRIVRSGEVKMTGSGGQRRVPEHFLNDLEIPIPPLSEQRRIAAVLDRAEALRAKRREALASIEPYADLLFSEMIGDPTANRNGWPVFDLQNVVREGTIVTYGIVQAGDECPGGVPYIRTGDIVDGKIAGGELRHTAPAIAAKFRRSRVETGDIVMSIRATVGTTALVPQALHGANLTQGTARIAPGDKVDRHFLLHHLRSRGTQNWINRQIKGATFREITLSRLRELPIVVPPLVRQREFSHLVAAVERLNIVHQRALIALDSIFSSLQHRAFWGEL
jgi:type I restriction enzyme S subunit